MSSVNLRISGPTPLPPRVREALRQDMVSHRSGGFRALVEEVVAGLAPAFGGPAAVLPFTCSGTGGLEAAVVNVLRPGQQVIVMSTGYFGRRLAEIAESAGLRIDVVESPWGKAAAPDDLRAALCRSIDVAAVLLTHNETSTGVLNPLAQLCDVVHQHSNALVVADVVSSLGATPVRMADWGVDVAVGVTQKALMAPPGLALIGVGQRALDAAAANPRRRYYFDFGRMAEAVAEGTTTYTPAIPVFYGLQESLRLIAEEGWSAVMARHQALAQMCRAGLASLGVELLADPAHASPTVTSLALPCATSAPVVREKLAAEHNVLVASGRGCWKERVLRIGHMGHVGAEEVADAVDALGAVLRKEVRHAR